jgi:hypothetical protein
MEGNALRYVARLRDDGKTWCVVDRRIGGYAVPTSLRLDDLPEDMAKLFADKLNRKTPDGRLGR